MGRNEKECEVPAVDTVLKCFILVRRYQFIQPFALANRMNDISTIFKLFRATLAYDNVFQARMHSISRTCG